jgi:hypothetical protein
MAERPSRLKPAPDVGPGIFRDPSTGKLYRRGPDDQPVAVDRVLSSAEEPAINFGELDVDEAG